MAVAATSSSASKSRLKSKDNLFSNSTLVATANAVATIPPSPATVRKQTAVKLLAAAGPAYFTSSYDRDRNLDDHTHHDDNQGYLAVSNFEADANEDADKDDADEDEYYEC